MARRTLCGLMHSSSGEDGLLAGWLSDVMVIPTPKAIRGNAAGGDWDGMWREPTPEKGEGVLSMAVCAGKACGQRSDKRGHLWKWRDGSRVDGFEEGDLFSGKAPFLYTSYAFKASLLWNVLLRYPSHSASSKEARFRLMAETRSGMSYTISSVLPEQATSSR